MNLAGGTINGGTLTTTSGGVMTRRHGTLNGVTISAGSTVTAAEQLDHHPPGTITNNGTIALNSAGNVTDLIISGAVTYTGGGSITMSNNTNNRIYGSPATDTLTNDATNTIQGAGQIGAGGNHLSLTNNGTIDANHPPP